MFDTILDVSVEVVSIYFDDTYSFLQNIRALDRKTKKLRSSSMWETWNWHVYFSKLYMVLCIHGKS